jgi:para-nitrobenzyl esterase
MRPIRTALAATLLMGVSGVAVAAPPLSTATTPIGEILDTPAAKDTVSDSALAAIDKDFAALPAKK